MGIEHKTCNQGEGQAKGGDSDSSVLTAKEGIDASDDAEGTSKHEDHFCHFREQAELDVVHALIAGRVYIEREDPAENEQEDGRKPDDCEEGEPGVECAHPVGLSGARKGSVLGRGWVIQEFSMGNRTEEGEEKGKGVT